MVEMEKKYFITGIGTGVGKTIVSVIVAEALQADYWKPIQAGLEEETDTETIRRLISNHKTVCHPEMYRLKNASSPHKSAALEGTEIDFEKIVVPETSNNLIIEGAGGLMVPLNSKYLMIDLIKKIDAEVILVSQNYLGSINHTLLSLQILKTQKIPVRMLVLNGEADEYSEKAIVEFSGIDKIFRIKKETYFSRELIKNYANKILPFFID